MSRPNRISKPSVVALVFALAVTLLLPPAAGPAAATESAGTETADQAADHTPETVPGALMVTYAEAPSEGVESALNAADASGYHVQELTDRAAVVEVPEGEESEATAVLATQPGVIAVEPERVYQFGEEEDEGLVPDDERFDEQWSHGQVNAPDAWEITTGDPDVTVAVLDTGVDGRHEDLQANIAEQVDVSMGRLNRRPAGTNNATCPVGSGPSHGTNVAGVVGAVGNNEVGIAGAAWDVGILDVALVSRASYDDGPLEGSCTSTDRQIVAGMQYVRSAAHDVDVVNISAAGIDSACPSVMQAAIDDARDAGIAVMASAGNASSDDRELPQVPAACNGVISVGAVGSGGGVAGYSVRHETLDIVGPGGVAGEDGCTAGSCVLTTQRGDSYRAVQGTSFSSPYAAGVAALAKSVNAGLSPDDIESLLERNAVPHEDQDGFSEAYGWGRIDAAATVAGAESSDEIEAPAENPEFPVGEPDAGPEDPVFLRVGTGSGETAPVTQSIATSRATFEDGQATHAVLARSDVYADALAGSTLAGTTAPILFTRASGGLPGSVEAEMTRVLPDEATVYLLGGSEALDPDVEEAVEDLGFDAVRLSGEVREGTARQIAAEARQWHDDEEINEVLLADRVDWPDAVGAGLLGAAERMPVLLAYVDELDPETSAALEELDPETIYVVGGTEVVGEDIASEASDAAGGAELVRLGGRTRDETLLSVGDEFAERLSDADRRVAEGMLVNMDRSDAFAPLLSGVVLAAGRDAVLLGTRRSDGSELPPSTLDYSCGRGLTTMVQGETDLVPTNVAETVADLFHHCEPDDD